MIDPMIPMIPMIALAESDETPLLCMAIPSLILYLLTP